MIVVDANLIGNLFIKSKDSPLTIQVFERDPDWYAPLLWQSEVRSMLTDYFRHNLLPLDKALQIMDEAHGLMIDHERYRYISSSLVLDFVSSSKCNSYDCEYVALEKR